MESEQGYGWGGLDADAVSAPLAWLRVAAGSTVNLLMLSERPFAYVGHWHQGIGEFVRCAGAVCRHCVERIGRQPRWAFGVQDDGGKVWAWEVGKIQAQAIRDGLADGLALRGCNVMVLRPGGRGNPPALVTVSAPDADAPPPPPCPDLALLLDQQWARQALRLGKGQQQPKAAPPSTVKESSFFSDLEQHRASKNRH